jgi:hypothetical protein
MLTTSVRGENRQMLIGVGLSMEKSVPSTHIRCMPQNQTLRAAHQHQRLALDSKWLLTACFARERASVATPPLRAL